MNYEEQLHFLRRMMNQMDMPCLVVPLDGSALPSLDMGLRGTLGQAEEAFRDWNGRMQAVVRERTVYYITDEFHCRYIALQLEGEPRRMLVIGPYTSVNVDREWIVDFMARSGLEPEWLQVLEGFYNRVRCLTSDQVLVVAVQALAEHMWGTYSSEYFERGVPESWAPLDEKPEERVRDEILNRVHLIEQRYESESKLMELVMQGKTKKVQLMLGHFSRAALERRADPTRDVRNYSIVLNTLMRKAAQQGGVHPMYIDRVSSEFARRIEDTAQWESFMALWSEMAASYCGLVRSRASASYSPVVSKVIARIDFDLAGDLTLRGTAAAFNINPSYLSTLFKKETGETLTEHVQRKRMERAAYLLSGTDLPVATVAQSCGIADDNYFIKCFRRCYGITPKQFRMEQRFGKKI